MVEELIANAKRLYRLKANQPLPKFKRYIFDDLVRSTAKLRAVYGSRGVGKTTILMQLLQQSPAKEKLYISCDHPMFYGISLFDFVDEYSKRGGEFICIDEVHEAENYEQMLKSIYDFLDIEVCFTGSSAIALRSPDFARRYSMYHLYPLSFREFLELSMGVELQAYTLQEIYEDHEKITDTVIDALPDKKILKHFYTFWDVGVYPFYFEDMSRYIDRINDTINKILHIDLSKIHSIQPDKVDTLKKILLTVCISEPFEVNIEKLAKLAGITKATLYKYLTYLDEAELISLIKNEAKRFANIRKPDKLYLANTNLSNALCIERKTGALRETFFVSQVRTKHSIYYANNGDFLIDEKYRAEIGGKEKSFSQIRDIPDSFVAADGIEVGYGKKIPLWLFGFLY